MNRNCLANNWDQSGAKKEKKNPFINSFPRVHLAECQNCTAIFLPVEKKRTEREKGESIPILMADGIPRLSRKLNLNLPEQSKRTLFLSLVALIRNGTDTCQNLINRPL